VVTWDGSFSLLGVGAAIGVVLAALGLILRQYRHEAPHTGLNDGGERGLRVRRGTHRDAEGTRDASYDVGGGKNPVVDRE
jgi:hypothetical protein